MDIPAKYNPKSVEEKWYTYWMKHNFFHSDSKKLIAAIDIEDIIVVETDDAILICKKDSSQRVKEIVDKLRVKDMDEYL